ncbi:MAG: rRNA synthase [Candidatus Parcubacteria bacterium]|jgi:23S rRNA pseudouridine1911/1915/1917 synthase|nr:rRNA synthase [Candidatus Parcubacteria bacterium]
MSNESANRYGVKILYEDDDIAAVDKPAGMMVHPDGRAHTERTILTDWIALTFPKAAAVGEPARSHDGTALTRSGIVHRLDTETSGVMLVAKTQNGFEHLKKQFQARTVRKQYLAFVWGAVKDSFGTIDRPIGRSGSDFRKWATGRGAKGELRPAETYWSLLWAGAEPATAEKFSLLLAEPKTGRTHQIRVHFNAVHHPVVGDRLYAPKRPAALGFERLALHSWSIQFENLLGDRVKVSAQPAADFESALLKVGAHLPKS